MSGWSLYGAAASAALGSNILAGPDTAYLIKSTYTFSSSHSLATVLAARAVDALLGTPIAGLAISGTASDASFPATWTIANFTFITISSNDVGGILLANAASGQPLLFASLGVKTILTVQDLEVSVTGASLSVG